MKKLILALLAVAMLSVFASSAEAGWRWRRGYYAPVAVRPYVAPVYVARPVVVARPVYVAPRPVIYHTPVYRSYHTPVYRSYYAPANVQVHSSYYGGGVRVSTPGFGLHISY